MRRSIPPDMPPEHAVTIRPRTVLMVALVLLGVAVAVEVVLMSERVLVWMFVSLLLALALNPAIDVLRRHGIRRRGSATAIVYLLVIAFLAGAGALIVRRSPSRSETSSRPCPAMCRS